MKKLLELNIVMSSEELDILTLKGETTTLSGNVWL
jgi:hypothetical protein